MVITVIPMSDVNYCNQCRTKQSKGAVFCHRCGSDLRGNTLDWFNKGNLLAEQGRYQETIDVFLN